MVAYTLKEGLYLYPTPAGAYYAICARKEEEPREFLKNILSRSETRALTVDNLQLLTGLRNQEQSFELLRHCQEMHWLQGLDKPRDHPSGLLENLLPDLLKPLSESGKVMLADKLGFSLASHGFPDEIIEDLAALSAELATVHERRPASLMKVLGISSHAWAMIDVFGNSQLGFWPLFIGANRFVIIIAGVPHFNQPEFVDLIWALSKRYADIS